MERLPPEILREIVYNLPISTFIHLCSTFVGMRQVCNDEHMWVDKFNKLIGSLGQVRFPSTLNSGSMVWPLLSHKDKVKLLWVALNPISVYAISLVDLSEFPTVFNICLVKAQSPEEAKRCAIDQILNVGETIKAFPSTEFVDSISEARWRIQNILDDIGERLSSATLKGLFDRTLMRKESYGDYPLYEKYLSVEKCNLYTFGGEQATILINGLGGDTFDGERTKDSVVAFSGIPPELINAFIAFLYNNNQIFLNQDITNLIDYTIDTFDDQLEDVLRDVQYVNFKIVGKQTLTATDVSKIFEVHDDGNSETWNLMFQQTKYIKC